MNNDRDIIILFLEQEFFKCVELHAKLIDNKIKPMDPMPLIIKKLITIRMQQLKNECEIKHNENLIVLLPGGDYQCGKCGGYIEPANNMVSVNYCSNCGVKFNGGW